jgi:hypothetical protein
VQLAGEVGLTMPRGVLIGIITHTVGGNDESEDSGMDEISGSLRQTEIISPVRRVRNPVLLSDSLYLIMFA